MHPGCHTSTLHEAFPEEQTPIVQGIFGYTTSLQKNAKDVLYYCRYLTLQMDDTEIYWVQNEDNLRLKGAIDHLSRSSCC